MEIGQSPIDSAYSRPTPTPAEQNNVSRQENLQTERSSEPTTSSGTPSGTNNGSVGGNIDTYA